MTTIAPTTPTPAVVPTGGPAHRSYAQGHVENAPDLTDDHGHTFAPVRVEAHYFRPHATAPWSWYATIHGTNPAGAWRYRLVTSNEENLDGRCPDYVAEFLADRHPGCRRPHPGPAQGHVEDPVAAIRRELTAQLDDLQSSSGPSAAPTRRTLTWALGMVDRITNEHALAALAAASAAPASEAATEGGDRARVVRADELHGGASAAAVRRFVDRWRELGRGDEVAHVGLADGSGQALTNYDLDRLILAATTPDAATPRAEGGAGS